MTPHLQNNQSKMDWRCGSSDKDLLCKYKALSSNPSPTKEKKSKPFHFTDQEVDLAQDHTAGRDDILPHNFPAPEPLSCYCGKKTQG
jgi:hypothetical protein